MVGETDAATQKGASQYLIFDKFKGMNTQAARWGLPDDEQAWLENLQPIALNKAFGVPAPAATLYSLTGETIVRQFGNIVIGTTQYMVHFCASGAAYATTMVGQSPGFPVTGTAALRIAPAGTFATTGGDAVELNAQRLLIADTVAGYSTWDGSVFVRQGGVSPNLVVTAGGTGYVGGATAAITGGSGTGATATVQTNAAGVVTGLTLTNPGTGFLPADTLTVTITGISGGTGATANAHVWPFLTPFPSTIAVAFGRVWLASGRVLIVSGVGSATFGAGFDDFSSADASVTTTLQDNDLTTQITALRFLNNYLYILGDNSVKSIGGISVTGAVTSFSIVTLSSDQGTTYLQSVISFNRLITFANTVGVYGVFGASVEKLSGPMDGIFALADFTQPLQAAVNDLNDIHTYLLLIRYRDPLVPGERSLLLGYMNGKWFVMNQGNSLRTIATMVLNGITNTFGSSGADVTQLLQNLSAGVSFKVSTSLSPHGNPIFGKRMIRAYLATTAGACTDLDVIAESEQGQVDTLMPHTNIPLQFVNNSGQLLTFVNNSNQTITFAAYAFTAPRTGLFSWSGRWIGLTATGTINRQQMHMLGIEYQLDAALTDRGLSICTPAVGPAPPPPQPAGTPITPSPPPPPGPPPPAAAPLLFVNGASCHYSAWKLADTGGQPPRLIVEGAQIDNTTLFGTNSALSFTNQLVVGPVTGKQFIFDSTFPTPGNQINQICIFAQGVNGNVAPAGVISGSNTQINDLTLFNYFIAVDAAENIYLLKARSDGSNASLFTWPAGTTGNVAPTQLFTGLLFEAVDFEYDTLNNQLWALDFTNNAAKAFSLAGAAGHVITGAATQITQPLAMNVGGDGRIYVVNGGATPKILIFPNGSNGNVAPTTTITGAATGMKVPSGIAVDASNNMYLTDFDGAQSGSAKSYVLAFAAGSSGNQAPSQKIVGDYCGLTAMVVGANTFAAGIEIGNGVLPGAPAFVPPATHFNAAAKVTSNTFTAGASRFGVLSVWSFNYNAGAATLFQTTAGNIGITLNAASGFVGGSGIALTLSDAGNATIVVASPNFVIPGWRHDLISWDTQTQKLQWFVNGGNTSQFSTITWSSTNAVAYAGGTWEIGDATNAMDIAELWFAIPSMFIDLTTSAGAWVKGDGVIAHAVSLGATGQTPLGSTPLLFMHGSGIGFATNLGTGGAFSLASGTLSAASTTP